MSQHRSETSQSTTLPLCSLTDLPRLFCGCGHDGCESFTMTDGELALHRGEHGVPEMLDRAAILRSMPEYQTRPWSEPRNVKVVDSPKLCSVAGCTKPAGGVWVCAHCLDDLEVALGDIPSLMEDLLILTTRQARITSVGGMRKRSEHTRWDDALDADESGQEPGRLLANAGYNRVPYVPQAGDLMAGLANVVATAARLLAEPRGVVLPARSTEQTSRWLLCHIQVIPLDPAGPGIVADLVRDTQKARKMIDRPDETVYLGVCDQCAAPMQANPDHSDHDCTTCGKTYQVQARLAAIHDRLMGSLLGLSEIAKLATDAKHFGQRLTLRQLEGWVARGRLVRAGARPHPYRAGEEMALYRAGDVLGLTQKKPA